MRRRRVPATWNLLPAHIITASHDPLRDEGEAYGELLKKAGNRVKVKRYEGVVHGFFSLQAAIDQGKTANRELAEELKASLKKVYIDIMSEDARSG